MRERMSRNSIKISDVMKFTSKFSKIKLLKSFYKHCVWKSKLNYSQKKEITEGVLKLYVC